MVNSIQGIIKLKAMLSGVGLYLAVADIIKCGLVLQIRYQGVFMQSKSPLTRYHGKKNSFFKRLQFCNRFFISD